MGLWDTALSQELTLEFVERLEVKPIEIDAAHDTMVVRPKKVAEILLH